MIVVIILTSIIVGMAFSVLSLVKKHMAGIQMNFINNSELRTFEQSLYLDFNRYGHVKYIPLEDAIMFSSEVDSIKYIFKDNIITTPLDTFNIEIEQQIFFFNGEEAKEGFIDAIKLETSKTHRYQSLFIFKKNDATLFLN